MRCLRFAVLLNGSFLERWHLRCLDLLEESSELAGVILAANRAGSTAAGVWSPLMRWYANSVGRRELVDVTRRFADLMRLGERGAHASLAPTEIDFILKLGRGPVPGEISPAPRYGIWCFQHEIQEDLLPFFREVYDGKDVTHAALLALIGPRGEASILEQGWFQTEKRSYAKNRDQVLENIAEWPARVSRRLTQDGSGPSTRISWTEHPGRGPTHRPQLLRFWARIAWRHLGIAWERLFRHWQWNIGVLRVPAGELLRPQGYSDASIEWFPLNNRKRFLADPFGIVRGGVIQIFCEEFAYRALKGRICTLAYSNHGFTSEPQPAIDLPVHMSYPFLIEDAGEIYCVPETCQADEVALFRAVEFPRRWSKVAVLLERFGGVDPTVFRHAGHWWLMCTKKGRQADVKLWIWHASDLRGPWTPHARNPVKTDVRSARPGGVPFVHDGALHRPAQDCSKTYGWRIVIQRITTLTPTEFAEEPVAVLEASPDSPFPVGRHTLTPVGEIVLIDGHRAVFVWDALLGFLGILARDFLGRLRRR